MQGIDVNTSILLELFNGSDAILRSIFMLWALRYLWVETRRRSLGFADWVFFKLPPSMGFIIAVIVSDVSVWLRDITIWAWRRFYYANAFDSWQLGSLLIAGTIGVVGGLCKIRSVTRPDYGDGPWLSCLALVLAFIVASLISKYAFV
jgi:hypothetical protein